MTKEELEIMRAFWGNFDDVQRAKCLEEKKSVGMYVKLHPKLRKDFKKLGGKSSYIRHKMIAFIKGKLKLKLEDKI